jgi:oligoribonuclease (3'-5' exoribonuclease)
MQTAKQTTEQHTADFISTYIPENNCYICGVSGGKEQLYYLIGNIPICGKCLLNSNEDMCAQA